jgi:putative NADH-flavin reductase
MSKSPSIAVICANGYIGKLVVLYLYDAIKESRNSDLRILTRSNAAEEKAANTKGTSMQQVTYSQPDTPVKVLSGVDVVISTPCTGVTNCTDMMGLQGEDWEKNKEILVVVSPRLVWASTSPLHSEHIITSRTIRTIQCLN